jgi:O-acetyl-ADP-ribose deacetylase (regulator of RNase III)
MGPVHPLDRVECVLGDITAQEVDAVVNAANARLRGGGGVDGAIHQAAGAGLLRECIERYPDGCPTGEARITSGHDLPVRHVIHTVGPVYDDGSRGEAALLAACHKGALALAAEHGLRSLAFPAISTGAFRYPWAEAAQVSIAALDQGLREHPGIQLVRMVLFSDELLEVYETELARQRG